MPKRESPRPYGIFHATRSAPPTFNKHATYDSLVTTVQLQRKLVCLKGGQLPHCAYLRIHYPHAQTNPPCLLPARENTYCHVHKNVAHAVHRMQHHIRRSARGTNLMPRFDGTVLHGLVFTSIQTQSLHVTRNLPSVKACSTAIER